MSSRMSLLIGGFQRSLFASLIHANVAQIFNCGADIELPTRVCLAFYQDIHAEHGAYVPTTLITGTHI